MTINKFKLGDKVRYLFKDKYPGGATLRKQAFATNRKILTVSSEKYMTDGSFYVKSCNTDQWTADEDCIISAIKPTILICRKIKHRED